MNNGLKISHLVSGFMAVLVGYTSSVAIIFQAIGSLNLSAEQANSWMLALGLGMGVSGLVLSLYYRMPILTAWSTPGAALLVVSLNGVPVEEAIGAFLFCGLLLTLTGVTGGFKKVLSLVPDELAGAMLAGILFRFGLGIFTSMQTNFALVALMCVVYLLGRRLFPRYTIALVLAAGTLYCAFTGTFDAGVNLSLSPAVPEFVMPALSLPVLVGVALPLYIVTMTSQNMPGVVTLKASGYEPPVSASLIVTGITTMVLAPFGGYTFNLAAITAAICSGPEADENPETRYKAALVTGVLYCVVGLLGATVIGLFMLAPRELVMTVAGLALLGTIGTSLSASLAPADNREAALVTFMTTVSGISMMGIGAPFWALVFGGLTSFLLQWRK